MKYTLLSLIALGVIGTTVSAAADAPSHQAVTYPECGICFEPMNPDKKPIIKLACTKEITHDFCLKCISNWAELSSTCPTCRRNAVIRDPQVPNQPNQMCGYPKSLTKAQSEQLAKLCTNVKKERVSGKKLKGLDELHLSDAEKRMILGLDDLKGLGLSEKEQAFIKDSSIDPKTLVKPTPWSFYLGIGCVFAGVVALYWYKNLDSFLPFC